MAITLSLTIILFAIWLGIQGLRQLLARITETILGLATRRGMKEQDKEVGILTVFVMALT